MSDMDRAKELVAENKAKLLDSSLVLASGQKLLIRYWPEVSKDDMDLCQRFLQLYGCSSNYPATSNIVDGPMVDGKVQEGVHVATLADLRFLPTRETGERKSLGLVQVLVKGSTTVPYTVTERDCFFTVSQTWFYDLVTRPSDMPSFSQGTTYRLAGMSFSRETGTYTYAIERRVRGTAVAVGPFDSEARHDQTGTEHQLLGARALTELEIGALTAGHVLDRAVRKNADCTFDIEKRDHTAVDQPATDVETRADQTASTEKHTQAAAAPAARTDGEAALHQIVVSEDRPTEFGLHASARKVVTPVDQPATDREARADQTSETAKHTQGTEAPAARTAEELAAHQIVTAEDRPTEFGLHASARRVVTPVDQTATDVETRADQTASTEKHTQAATAPAARTDGEAALHQIVVSEDRPTEFGLHASARKVVTPVDQTATDVETRADQTASTEKHTQAAAAPAARTDGEAALHQIVVSEDRPTEFGLHASARKVVTPVPQDSGWIPYPDKDGTSYLRSFRHQAALTGAGSVTLGMDETTNNGLSVGPPNKFGLYDGVASRRAVPTSGSVDTNGDYSNYSYPTVFADNPSVTYTVTVRYTSFLSRAQALVSSVQMAQHSGLPAPGVFPAGGGKWRAVKVTSAATPPAEPEEPE